MNLLHESEKIFKEVVSWRREIHKHPELGMQENQTALFIEKTLQEIGIRDVRRISKTGVLATINGKARGGCIALRADIDALPGEEKTDLPYASDFPGVAHLCGHDMHTAILLGCAKILQNYSGLLGGPVKLLFQPGEEGCGGAKVMIDSGVLENPIVKAIFGLHCWPEATSGRILFKKGIMCAAADTFSIEVIGSQGHGAHPDQCVDPVVITGELISSLQTLVSREIPPYDSAVLTIGKIIGGTAPNIIPERVILEGTIRSLIPSIRELMDSGLKRIAEGVCSLNKGIAIVRVIKGPPPLVNDNELVKMISIAAEEIIGKQNVDEIIHPSLGSEDFAEYLTFSKGAYFRLGTGFQGKNNPPLHSSAFNPNEESLKAGVAVMANIAFAYYKNSLKYEEI